MTSNVRSFLPRSQETESNSDPLCPGHYSFTIRECQCRLIAEVRADELRKAQEAVAQMPLNGFHDGGREAALIFQDGWATGFAAALKRVRQAIDEIEVAR